MGAILSPSYPAPSVADGKYHLTQWEVLWWAIVPHIRAPILAVLATMFLEPVYRAWTMVFFDWFEQFQYSSITNDAVFFAVSSGIARAVLFVVMNSFFFFAAQYGWLKQLKRGKNQWPSDELIWNTVKGVPFDLFFFTPAAAFVGWPVFVWVGAPGPRDPLPTSPIVMFAQYLFCFMFFEIGFYASHWLLHRSVWLYQHVHKKHHQFIGTMSVAADRSHPIENLLSATLPIVGGPMLVRIHPLAFVVHVLWRLGQSYEEHAGLSFHGTWLHKLGLTHTDNAAFHDAHHLFNNGNIGLGTSWLDVLCDTMSPTWARVKGTNGYVAGEMIKASKDFD